MSFPGLFSDNIISLQGTISRTVVSQEVVEGDQEVSEEVQGVEGEEVIMHLLCKMALTITGRRTAISDLVAITEVGIVVMLSHLISYFS